MSEAKAYGSPINPRTRASIVNDVISWLGLRGQWYAKDSFDRTAGFLEGIIRAKYGNEVRITVTRCDPEACSAVVQFNGPPNMASGDREIIRINREQGTWVRDLRE